MNILNSGVIDNRYQVNSICSSSGGMGDILFVTDLLKEYDFQLVLKSCKVQDEESIKRFRREIRLLNEYQGNSKVVQITDSNIDHEPPYFVMKYYPTGDLSTISDQIIENYEKQEEVFFKMIACISEIHARGHFHRDIKPENFLIDGDSIVVSDFGLSMEVGSPTQFTNTLSAWGTQGYTPPEYQNGGFKYAEATGDIFMLGKTFYYLLTQRAPLYLSGDNIPDPLYYIIERCCNYNKENRYQTLSELKQNLMLAYDVLLNRGGLIGKVSQLLISINSKFEQEGQYVTQDVRDFIEQLSLLDGSDKVRICKELHHNIFTVIAEEPIVDLLPQFLDVYSIMVSDADYSFEYAQVIARNMQSIFNVFELDPKIKSVALEIAINAAIEKHRFAAMDICKGMITTVNNELLGMAVSVIIQKNKYTFVSDIEPSECRDDIIRQSLLSIRA